MRIVITGGGGFLGQRVASALLARGGLNSDTGGDARMNELVLVDQVMPQGGVSGVNVRYATGDIADRSFIKRIFAPQTDAVFHLAAVVSAGAEADFDLGYRVNVDAARLVFEACRAQPRPPRLVFTSSVAAFGGELPEIILDISATTPQTSYGSQKVIGELLVADYTRKGYIDGRCLRLPTIVVRPGKPNRAASGFMSSIIREPLNNETAICPVSRETGMWISSPERAVEALVRAMELPPAAWGVNRVLNAPGISVTVSEALAALEKIAGKEALERVRFERDLVIEKIVLGWPARFSAARAKAMGFGVDSGIEDVIKLHMRARAG